MTLRVGQKVVCVNDAFPADWNDVPHKPVKGPIYTVREVLVFDFDEAPNTRAILLNELVNPKRHYTFAGRPTDCIYCECPFWIERFRPLIEHKTDISIFKKMLAPKEMERVE